MKITDLLNSDEEAKSDRYYLLSPIPLYAKKTDNTPGKLAPVSTRTNSLQQSDSTQISGSAVKEETHDYPYKHREYLPSITHIPTLLAKRNTDPLECYSDHSQVKEKYEKLTGSLDDIKSNSVFNEFYTNNLRNSFPDVKIRESPLKLQHGDLKHLPLVNIHQQDKLYSPYSIPHPKYANLGSKTFPPQSAYQPSPSNLPQSFYYNAIAKQPQPQPLSPDNPLVWINVNTPFQCDDTSYLLKRFTENIDILDISVEGLSKTLWFIGNQLATYLSKETYNMYRSFGTKGVYMRKANKREVNFLVNTGTIKASHRSVTLIQYNDVSSDYVTCQVRKKFHR